MKKKAEGAETMETIYLAGGCFWGMQKYFDQFPGVLETEVGYANGPTENPSYQEVCRSSGHAETLRLVFDPARISLTELLDRFFLVIDPLSINRQGGDIGVQYRTGIYYVNQSQRPAIEARMQKEAEALGVRKLEVELAPLANFYSAEEYHQKYLDKNPGGYCHIPRRFFDMADKA